MTLRFSTLLAIGLVAASLAPAQPSRAQDAYPDRRISFISPYAPGGATDTVGRILAAKLAESWKQPVVVENKAGGGGNVGNEFVAKAAGDGYTVLVAITQIVQAPSLFSKLSYDVFKDLTPVSQVAVPTIVFAVPAERPYRSLKDFIEAARGAAKPLSYGSFGTATTSHLYGELLKKTAKIDMTHVPYRGAAPMINDLLGNQIDGGFIDLSTGAAQIAAGTIRALAVGGEKRRSTLPDTPTLAELGYPGFEPEGWVGIFVPSATPKPIVDKLSAELDRIIKMPDVSAKLEAINLVPAGGTAGAFAAIVQRDAARWADIARSVGVRGE